MCLSSPPLNAHAPPSHVSAPDLAIAPRRRAAVRVRAVESGLPGGLRAGVPHLQCRLPLRVRSDAGAAGTYRQSSINAHIDIRYSV